MANGPGSDVGALVPIVISNVAAAVQGTSVIVSWLTSAPSSSLVRYGVAPNRSDLSSPEQDTISGSGLVTSHSVTLSGLMARAWYFFRVQSRYNAGKDGGNNVVMDGYTFTADGAFQTPGDILLEAGGGYVLGEDGKPIALEN